MLSKTLEETLHRAIELARSARHEMVTLEHLLLSMLEDPDALAVLRACGGDIERMRTDLEAHIRKGLGQVVLESGDPAPSAGFQRVLQRAVVHVQSSGRETVTGANVLIAVFYEKESHALYILKNQDISRLDVLNYVSHGIVKAHKEVVTPHLGETQARDETNALVEYCENLNTKASQGSTDPLVGRESELNRMMQILCRRRRNNPLLVGEPGVGKTALAEGLAQRIVQGAVPGPIAGAEVFSLDLGGMLAGTRYRGDFEERLKAVVKAIEEHPKAILFVDEVHTIVGAGATSGGAMDASNLLKPALVNGKLRCIGSTTYKEYRAYFEKDRALLRRFRKVDIEEPSQEDALRILRGVKSRYEDYYGLRYSDPALRRAVELSVRYIHDYKLPDKAIDILDEVGAAQAMLPQGRRRKMIQRREIEDIVAGIARIPARTIGRNDRIQLKTIERDLKAMVYGQDKALEALASAVKMARSGLRDAEKPVGSYLFTGPTGVGKTESARQLAQTLGIELHRFDMSEYMERHAISRLIGAPPGYVGFDQGGLLTDAVDKTPYAVVLLDEIEKAHPDVYNILLQIMDYGKLTDHSGKAVDFRNAILIMTSNAGAMEIAKPAVGFANYTREGDDTAIIERLFSPEFRNRLDAIIPFHSLKPEAMERIVDKMIMQLEPQLSEKNVTITLTPTARQCLARKGFDPAFGARPLARVLEAEIKKPLSEALLFGDLVHGGDVVIRKHEDKLRLDITPCSQVKRPQNAR